MIYGFVCDCGQRAVEDFSVNDPEKKLRCPRCGAWMGRDFSHIGIGGDLPAKWAGRIRGGKSFSQASKDFYVQGDLGAEDRLLDEVGYIQKHAGPGETAAMRAEANRMGVEFRQAERVRETEERFATMKIDIPQGFDIPSGD